MVVNKSRLKIVMNRIIEVSIGIRIIWMRILLRPFIGLFNWFDHEKPAKGDQKMLIVVSIGTRTTVS